MGVRNLISTMEKGVFGSEFGSLVGCIDHRGLDGSLYLGSLEQPGSIN
jgi:hypothetical protein